jgi:hypothetical protein
MPAPRVGRRGPRRIRSRRSNGSMPAPRVGRRGPIKRRRRRKRRRIPDSSSWNIAGSMHMKP